MELVTVEKLHLWSDFRLSVVINLWSGLCEQRQS